MRWEPFFFDWFGGAASEDRAMTGLRASIYASDDFGDFKRLLSARAPDRPERLGAAVFAAREPVEMLIDEVEAIWSAIDAGDDWSAFNAKVASVRAYGAALALISP